MLKKITTLFLWIAMTSVGFAADKNTKRHTSSAEEDGVYHNTAYVKIKTGEVERYLKAAEEAQVVEETRREPGNLGYRVFQNASNPELIVFDELWKNAEALDLHLKTPHMINFFTAINFNLASYTKKPPKSKKATNRTVFSDPKDSDYVIAELVLEGFNSKEIKKRPEEKNIQQ